MPEKTSTPSFEDQLNLLIGVVFSHKGDVHKESTAGYGTTSCQQARLCECCGASGLGYRTWNSVYATSLVPRRETADWDTKNIIVSGFIDAAELPTLKTGRSFIRLKGDKKDFLLTWENT